MPLYEFKCEHCEHNFERLAGVLERVACPECGKPGAIRMITTHATYKIRGNNGASVTPKKDRG